jgi:protease-4
MLKFLSVIQRMVKFFWRGLSILRQVLGNLIVVGLLVLIVLIAFYPSEPRVPDGAALVLDLQGDIVEQESETLLSGHLFSSEHRSETLLKNVIDVIDFAAHDKHISMMVLDLKDLGRAGPSKLAEIGQALKRFKAGGKKIIVAGNYYDQRQYYLAAHADQVYLHPMGGVRLSGFGVYRQYFKSALDKLLIQLHVFRVGTYKSALEPFLRDDMSPDARKANLAWLEVLWQAYKKTVADLRGMTPEDIDHYANDFSGYLARVNGDTAWMALDFGLVDDLKTIDEVNEELRDLVGEGANNAFKQIHFDQYLQHIAPRRRQIHPGGLKVGVIVARGIILDGPQPKGKIGGDTLAHLIQQARRNDKIRALVVRIDSPGGSALAAETIRREIERTVAAGKPVVVSMGSVAASGGYWIAAAADEIWASPTTITGSIGIYSAFATFEKSLDALGIHNDGVGTTRTTDAFDPTRPLNPQVADAMEQIIQNLYGRFIRIVAEGRSMPLEEVEKIAQGRVWAGKTAQQLGLVDQLGDLADALHSAAQMAGLKQYDVIYVKQPLTAREKLIRRINRFLSTVAARLGTGSRIPLVRVYEDVGREARQVLELNDPRGGYALCLTCDVR